jgi:hypothetical protein
MLSKIYTIIVLFAVIAVPSFSQEAIDSTEIIAEVPALDQFHDVIYPIWHVAYPSKDYAALRSYVGDIEKGAQKIYEAQLPGILQDKQEMWTKGTDEFKVAVEEYKKLAADKDDDMLLKAAENLHSKYESLIRIIHPVLPELDQFHQVLYMIYHKYLPREDYQQIYLVSDDLVEKSEALTKTILNTEDAELQKKFDNYTEQLLHSSQKLREQLKSNNYEMVKLGVEDVHRVYQKIESLFENK